MVFVTTGTQLPFDRLLEMVDHWAVKNPDVKVLAQAFSTQNSFPNIEVKDLLTPSEYKQAVMNAKVIVGHAGMGTIITAHEHELPVIIVPRRFDLGEHRNDHQLATTKKFEGTEGVYVAEDAATLARLLDTEHLSKCNNTASQNRKTLVNNLKSMIADG
jgi:UDP-N-acetylglucosamine transferase subunit ALG13